MKFSVTIPAFKSQFLKEAIESVVNQTYQDWELIIVDDCSPEDLRSIVLPFLKDNRISYYRNEKNCGAVNVVDNWNICLNYCTGNYVICMGDDDRLLPICMEVLIKLMNNYPNLNVYHLQTEIIDEKGLTIEELNTRPEKEGALSMITRRWEGDKQFIGDFCYRREHLISVGGYYFIPFAWGSDDITAFRAALLSGIANTQKTVFQYRENRYSISLSKNDREKVDSVLLQREWYCNTFSKLLPYPETALKLMFVFTEKLIFYHILNDMKQRGLCGYIFWSRNARKYELSQYKLLKIFTSSIITRY